MFAQTLPDSSFADDEQLLLKLPTNFQEARAVKSTLLLYKETCSGLVVALLISLYLFLQARLLLVACPQKDRPVWTSAVLLSARVAKSFHRLN